MIIGYSRVSTLDQNLDRQTDQLREYGCERIYMEKITGTKKERPELQKMLDTLRDGDTLVICDLTRLSRSTKDLFELVDTIHSAGADIKSLKEPWLDTTTPQGRLLFSIFSGVSQFERDLIQVRTMEGLKAARARGRSGGRPAVDPKKIDMAMNLYKAKACSISDILKTAGISRATFYAYVKKNS